MARRKYYNGASSVPKLPFSCPVHFCKTMIPTTVLLSLCLSSAAFTAPSSRASSQSELALFGRWRRKTRGVPDAEARAEAPLADARQDEEEDSSRRIFLSTVATSTAMLPHGALAKGPESKQTGLSDDQLREIIKADMVDKSFLVTADITRSVYDETATFTDEIDEYTMDKWIKGTQSLFVASGSRVSLVGDVDVNKKEVTFRFDEDLMFNIPFKPVVALTGKVVLTRDETTGLITSYREFWDQSVNEVLKTAKFGKRA
ncbi:hypothetical protein THAOC_34669 [Thalassiosira oceanica]|uniref:Uncharacterized protein n=1 Tax=Thalassiosira oceanica TaxID=159749 RepID=K0RC67_THAOC|nr:hypothetical protein THAOC_34669 [Thalassiosira oceanica]|eukprot:EJK46651.1 hypothetical protein THAOC_34669 [Thalassiosira oceanica]